MLYKFKIVYLLLIYSAIFLNIYCIYIIFLIIHSFKFWFDLAEILNSSTKDLRTST